MKSDADVGTEVAEQLEYDRAEESAVVAARGEVEEDVGALGIARGEARGGPPPRTPRARRAPGELPSA
jgi:hypothetical protein